MQDRNRRASGAIASAAMLVVVLAATACGDDPIEVEFEVIEETTFDPSLSVDLSSMNRTATGVYWKDLVVGTGDAAVIGTTPFLTRTIWLTDGTEIDSGIDAFLMGNNQRISGLEDGIINMLTGGTRQLVIPPNRAFGGAGTVDLSGNVVIPGGAVVIYEVTVDSIFG